MLALVEGVLASKPIQRVVEFLALDEKSRMKQSMKDVIRYSRDIMENLDVRSDTILTGLILPVGDLQSFIMSYVPEDGSVEKLKDNLIIVRSQGYMDRSARCIKEGTEMIRKPNDIILDLEKEVNRAEERINEGNEVESEKARLVLEMSSLISDTNREILSIYSKMSKTL